MKRILIQILIIASLSIPMKSRAANQFIDFGNGTVCDSSSGLVWLKNANCFGAVPLQSGINSAASLGSGQCGLSDGSIAGSWSVPDLDTLKIFSGAARADGWANFADVQVSYQAGFNIFKFYYWTSSFSRTANAPGHTDYYYWTVSMPTGNLTSSVQDYSSHDYSNFIWPTRGGGQWGALTLTPAGNLKSVLNVGQNNDISYKIVNTGKNSVSLGQTSNGESGSIYSILNDTCATTVLLPGSECTISLKVESTILGSFSTRLSIPNSSACGTTDSIIAQPSVTVLATISGTITDTSTGNGLAGATVTLSTGETTTTDTNGDYIFNPAPSANTRSVTFSKSGYGSNTTSNVTTSASVGAIVNTHLTPTGLLNILGASFAPQQNVPFSGQVKITGGTAPYTFSIVGGSLPDGLTLDAGSGVISGKPTVTGSFPITVRVTDSGTGLTELGGSIEVQESLAFTTVTPIAGATISAAYASTIVAAGGKAPYSYAITGGVLPAGLSLNATTGTISGTPTTIQNNVITVMATDALGRTKSDTFMLGVGNALGISTTRLNDGIVGKAYSGPVPIGSNIVGQQTWSVATGSSLPDGLLIDAATGAISGTPTTAINKTIKLTLTDGIARTITKDITFNVVPALQISTATLPDGYLNYAYSTVVSAAGGLAPYTYSLGGTLNSGLTLAALTGTISGTPTASGLANISITATDATWPTPQSVTSTYSLRVNPQATLNITTGNGNGTVSANSGTINWTGTNGTAAYNAGTTVLLTAAPTSGYALASWGGACSGTSPCSVTMSASKSVSATFSLLPPAISSANNSSFTVGTAGTFTISTVASSVTPVISTISTLPAGIVLADNGNGTATISGTPATGTAGSYPITINAVNAAGTTSQAFTLIVAKIAATVSLGNLSQTYDGAAKSVMATTVPAGKAVAFTYNGSATAPINAGSYAVVATISENDYQGSATGTLVIGKATAPVTLENLAVTYDGTPKAASATTTPAGLNVNFTYNGSLTALTGVGSYAVIGTISDSNYQGSASGTQVIGKATAIVTLANLNQTYDGTGKTATATTTPTGRTVIFTYDGSLTAPVTVGSYAVVGTISDLNYQGSASGTLIISKATATVTLANLNQTYDGTAKSATAATTPAGKTVAFTYDGSPVVPTTPGRYTVVATVNDTNFQGSGTGTLIIGKGNAIVTLGSLSQTYDGTAKAATAITIPAGKPAIFTYNGSAVAPTAVGSYAVVATINDSNYQGSTTGTLVISKGNATVTLGSLAATYDGTAKAATATTTPVGLSVNFTYSGSATAPTAVGSYAVVGTISDSAYQGSTTGSLVIGKAAATVTLDNLNQILDGSVKTVTATTIPAGKSVTITYNGSAIAPTAAGTYAVVATISDSNYQGSASGTLVVSDTTKPTLTVSALADGSITRNATFNTSGTVSDLSGIKNLTVNGVTVTLINGAFSYPVTLQPGTNAITVIVTDMSDNSTTDSRSITLDQAAPELVVTAPADNSKTALGSTTVTGTINETSTVTAKVNNGSAQSAAMTSNNFEVTVNLASGLNTIAVTATDLAGNTASVSRSITFDNVKPSLAITDPAQDITTALNSIVIGGTVSDAITAATVAMTADGLNYTPSVAQNGTFSQSIPLAAVKTYSVVVTATDQAGNSSTAQRNIIKIAPLVQPTISDALKVLLAVVGTTSLTPDEKIRYDVAPLGASGTPLGNGTIDSADIILILRRSIGIGSW